MYFRRRIIAQIQCHKRPWERINDAKPQMSQKSDFDRLTHSHMAHEWFPVAAFSFSHYAMELTYAHVNSCGTLSVHRGTSAAKFFCSVPTIALCLSVSLALPFPCVVTWLITIHRTHQIQPKRIRDRDEWRILIDSNIYIFKLHPKRMSAFEFGLWYVCVCMCGYASENHKNLHSTNIIIILNTEIWLPLQTIMDIHDQYHFLCMRVTGLSERMSIINR